MAYRRRFGHDVVVDLVGYRRHGHNEQDEAAYTQPLLAAAIAQHPTVRDRYSTSLVERGIVSQEQADGLQKDVLDELRAAHEALKESIAAPHPSQEGRIPRDTGDTVVTAVGAEALRELNEQLLRFPDWFTPHPKLLKQLERRRDLDAIDWGHAEALAFASLLVEGIPIRITGQDTERGTFSHRHAVLHDVNSGATFTPMQHLDDAGASFEIHNSPLSEYACVGFEYGYSAAAPEALVLWEAQFGDFANGAQIIIDQFISAGLSKWGETSRLTLLLPHGYEGNGPEHSSARLERFLQLAAQENIRIANCTTAAQYFHLLRRKQAASARADLAQGDFAPVLDDRISEKEGVTRLVLCQGKVYYDIVGHEQNAETNDVAVARLEQLYPFPDEQAAAVVRSYPNLREVVWAQEEPQNMGAWRAIRHRLEEATAGVPLSYAGRPWRASPSEGYPTSHLREQDRIVKSALGG